MSVGTKQPAQDYIKLETHGVSRRGQDFTPAEPVWTNYIGPAYVTGGSRGVKAVGMRVPRLWKPANGGAASRDGHGWPYDMSIGTGRLSDQQGHLPHPPVYRIVPDRRAGLTTGGDALRSASPQRIPPALVRRALG